MLLKYYYVLQLLPNQPINSFHNAVKLLC